MAADHIAVLRPGHGADDRAALACRPGAPLQGEVMLGARHGMRGEPDVISPIGARHCRAPGSRASPKTATARRDDGPDWEEQIVSMQQYSSFCAENKCIKLHRGGRRRCKNRTHLRVNAGEAARVQRFGFLNEV
jgi:hypothetical protein